MLKKMYFWKLFIPELTKMYAFFIIAPPTDIKITQVCVTVCDHTLSHEGFFFKISFHTVMSQDKGFFSFFFFLGCVTNTLDVCHVLPQGSLSVFCCDHVSIQTQGA